MFDHNMLHIGLLFFILNFLLIYFIAKATQDNCSVFIIKIKTPFIRHFIIKQVLWEFKNIKALAQSYTEKHKGT